MSPNSQTNAQIADFIERRLDPGHSSDESIELHTDDWMTVIDALRALPGGPAEQCEPTLPCELIVGAGHFHKGVKVALAQDCITRLYDHMRTLECRLGMLRWKRGRQRGRTPPVRSAHRTEEVNPVDRTVVP